MTVSLYIYIVSLVCIREREREREKERISLLVNIFVQSSLCSLIQARGTMCVCERERGREKDVGRGMVIARQYLQLPYSAIAARERMIVHILCGALLDFIYSQ